MMGQFFVAGALFFGAYVLLNEVRLSIRRRRVRTVAQRELGREVSPRERNPSRIVAPDPAPERQQLRAG